ATPKVGQSAGNSNPRWREPAGSRGAVLEVRALDGDLAALETMCCVGAESTPIHPSHSADRHDILRRQHRAATQELQTSRVPARLKFLGRGPRSEEHTSELQSRGHLVCRLLLEKKNT